MFKTIARSAEFGVRVTYTRAHKRVVVAARALQRARTTRLGQLN